MVLDFNGLFSDAHCPISFTIECTQITNEVLNNENVDEILKIKRWDNDKTQDYNGNLNDDGINRILAELNSINTEDPNIDNVVEQISNILLEAATSTFETYKYNPKVESTNKNRMPFKPWFNEECKEARTTFRRKRGKYKGSKSDIVLNEMKTAEKKLQTHHELQYSKI